MSNIKCEHCGANVMRYWHKLTPGLVGSLVKLYTKVCDKGENIVHKSDLDLDHSEYGNFQKLRFHALIAKFRPEGHWDHSTWVITKRGVLFLKGLIKVPDKVKTYRNKVEAHSDHPVNVTDVMKSEPHWETYSDFIQKQGDLEFIVLPEEEEKVIKTIKTVKKKKGKKYCPQCGTQLKRKIIDSPQSGGSVIITEVWQCINCDYNENI